MTILVAGATGAPGSLLTAELLDRGLNVKAVVRSPEKLPENIKKNSNLSVIRSSVLDLSDAEITEHVKDCQAVASCLGHTLD